MNGCRCQQLADDFVDMSDCPIHPVACEALHPETGIGCHHYPGHDGQHAYVIHKEWV